MSDHAERPDFAETHVNLASAGLGARPVSATDEFFAPLERMIDDSDAIFYPDRYDDNGKWMDGWETRRRRMGGNDHAVIALAVPGWIVGVEIDTAHFTGNYPPAASLEAASLMEGDPDEKTVWTRILPMVRLGPSQKHFQPIRSDGIWTHIRLHIYPDGGIARLRVYGRPDIHLPDGEMNLAGQLEGARVVAVSDTHYGDYRRILAPDRGKNMGDGWETARRRRPGNEWMIVALARRGIVRRAEIDTSFYKGNFPDRASLRAADLTEFAVEARDAIVTSSMFWQELMSRRHLQANHVHSFDDMNDIGPVTHVCLNIFPDGGVSRLRLWGEAV